MKWTSKMDRRLLAEHERGLPFEKIGKLLGTTKGSVISRWHRLNGMVFPCDIEASKQRQIKAAEKQRQKAEANAAGIKKLQIALRLGRSRADAIMEARKAGATFEMIGRFLDLTRQRIHQIQR